jgi:2',3'-cyclic-nucleotide 2'-phosphodiesterase (5'-nucleotidase family)
MKRTALIALSALLVLIQAGCRTDAPLADRGGGDTSVTLSVIGTNDVHGAMVEKEGAGGLALFGGYVANLRDARARDGGAVLLIDAGDMWQGTLESNIAEGAPVVAAYNALRYDAVAIGNHEFDFGPEGPSVIAASDTEDPRGALKARAKEANFPLLAANLIDENIDAPVNWPNVQSSYRIEIAGITAGIIGVTSMDTPESTLAAHIKGLRIAELATTIRREAEALTAAGAHLIIVTAHAGGRCDRFDDPTDLGSCNTDSEIFRVARALPNGLVDLIVAGHVHKAMAHEVNGIAIISSWAEGRYFGRVDFQIADGKLTGRRVFPPHRICRYIYETSGECRAVADSAGASRGKAHGAAQDNAHENAHVFIEATYEGKPVHPDRAIARVIAPAIAAAEKLKSEKLGPHLETAFRRRPAPESPIGNLLTDIMLASAPQADVAIHNTLGGIRADLPAGDLTYGSVYEMFPFDNRIVHLSLSGAELKAVLANQIEGPVRRGHISGISVNADCDDGELDVTVRKSSGMEILDHERVLIVTNDFLVSGGDGVLTPVMPTGGFDIEYEGPLLREVIVDWMRARDANLNEDQFNSESTPRWNLPGPAPVRCELTAQ